MKQIRAFSIIIVSILVLSVTAVVSARSENSLYFFSSAYGKYGNFVRLNLATMTIQPLGVRGNYLSVSPDSQYLVYQGKSDAFHAYNLAAGTDQEFEKIRAYYSEPVFISRHVFAFLKQTNQGTHLYMKSVLNGQERQLPHPVPEGVRYTANLSFVPSNGDNLTFVLASGDSLYLITESSAKRIYKAENKADHVRYPAVSPDGTKITFVSDLKKGIWLIRTNGTGLTQLTMQDGQYTTWSPDGQYIAFSSVSSAYKKTGSFTHRIWVMKANGSNPRQLEGKDGKGIGIMGNLIWR